MRIRATMIWRFHRGRSTVGMKRLCGQLVLGPIGLLVASSGCHQPLKPIFDPIESAMTWPGYPAAARVRYVGQLRGAADLKPPSKPFEALNDLLFGAKEPENLYGPRSIIGTNAGQCLWVADPGGRCLHRFDLQDRTYKKITQARSSPLLGPVDLCAGPAQTIFLCDSEDSAIHQYSTFDGTYLRTLRLPEDIRRPVAITYHDGHGELYVVDAAAHDIKVLDAEGRLLRIIGSRGSGAGEFNFPCDVITDGQRIWVVDAGNSRVQSLSLTGEPISTFGKSGDAPGDLALPKSVASDSDGQVYVVDARFENVQIFAPDGTLLLFFGTEGSGPGEFWLPGGIYIDPADHIWICDTYNGRLQVYQYLRARVDQPDPGVTIDSAKPSQSNEGSKP